MRPYCGWAANRAMGRGREEYKGETFKIAEGPSLIMLFSIYSGCGLRSVVHCRRVVPHTCVVRTAGKRVCGTR